VIPTSWNGFEAQRVYRGVRYILRVVRAGPGNQIRLEVNDNAIDGTVIAPPPAGAEEVLVVATIG
jgi:hypothetical protein